MKNSQEINDALDGIENKLKRGKETNKKWISDKVKVAHEVAE